MTHYIGKVLTPMSVLEIIIYSILGAILVGFMFKWFIYDKFIKPKSKKVKKAKLPEGEDDDEEN